MKQYSRGDDMTLYVVVTDDGRGRSWIQGYTDEKEYAKMYLEFHKCDKFKLKVINGTSDSISHIIDENVHDEIQLYRLVTKNPDGSKKHKTKEIVVPLTATERMLVNDEAQTFMTTRINYGYLQGAFYYLKDKYQRALSGIFLKDIMNQVCLGKQSPILSSIDMDELMILFRSYPDHFGI